MSAPKLIKWIPAALKKFRTTQNSNKTENCQRTVYGMKDLIRQEKPVNVFVEPISIKQHEHAVQMIKEHFLKEHVLVRAQGLDFRRDYALDEYLHSLLRQGNSMYAKTDGGIPVGICVNIASSSPDPENLRKYAFYRQDPMTKNFLYFTAKLQETPNLWEAFKVSQIFEIKMLAVVPEYRRQGLATMLAEASNELAETQGFDIVRMDCINPFEVAERMQFHCIMKYPLHKLSGHSPGVVRVYVRVTRDVSDAELKSKRRELEKFIEVAERMQFHCIMKYPLHKLSGHSPGVVRVYVRVTRDVSDAELKSKRRELEKFIE